MRGLRYYLNALWQGTEERAGSPSPENPSTSLSDPAPWLMQWAQGGGLSQSGVAVTPHRAMMQSAVFSCVRNICEDLAALPLHIFGEQRVKLTAHPAYELLHEQPNPLQSSFDWLVMELAHVQLWGAGYNEIEVDQGGRPLGIWPIPPWMVEPKLTPDGRDCVFHVRVPGRDPVTLPSWKVLHIPGLAFDGINAKSVLSFARDTVGGAMAAEHYGSAFFRNSARPSGVLKLPPTIDVKKGPEVLRLFNQANAGLDNVARTALLTLGAEWTKTGFTQEEAQFLETRKFSVQDVGRFWRMPPSMMGDGERRFANNEQEAIQYVVHCLTPWMRRVEGALNRSSLLAGEPGRAKFMANGLMRGDSAARGRYFATGRQWGWLCVDDIRELEDMPPLPDGAGQVYLQPVNMADAADPGAGDGAQGGAKVEDNPGTQGTTN